MPRKRQWPPRIYPHKGRDRIRIWVAGKPKDITLGKSGSEEARAAYRRIVLEMDQSGGALPLAATADTTCLELVVSYLEHAEASLEHRDFHNAKKALEPVVTLYGPTPAGRFGVPELEIVRGEYVRAGYARRHCNRLATWVRRAWRWAARHRLVPRAAAAELRELEPLRRKKKCPASGQVAPETPKVRPAPLADVLAALPHCLPVVRAMVQLQRYTGCRPGEVVVVKPRYVDRHWQTVGGVPMWLYSLGEDGEADGHKNEWRGAPKWIPIGPRGQEVLAPYLLRDPDAYCFSPAEAMAARALELGRAYRPGKSRQPGARYTTGTYDRAVHAACDKANGPCCALCGGPRCSVCGGLCQRWGGKFVCGQRACRGPAVALPWVWGKGRRLLCGSCGQPAPCTPWAPNQIRHLVGTDVRREHGKGAAQAVLGHDEPETTEIYAERLAEAAKIIAQYG